MKFNTAICFILCGFTFYMLETSAGDESRKKVVSVCAWIILAAGMLHLSEYLLRWNAGIDEFFWKERPETIDTTYPGRMSVITAIHFTLLGFIFLMLGEKKYHWLIQVFLVAMVPASLLVTFSRLFGASFLDSIPYLSTMALNTSILFILLCLGIFFSSRLGYFQIPFMKKIISFFVMIFVVRTIIFFAINKNNEQTANKYKWLKHSHELLLMTEQVNTQCNKIQGDIRGYIITGEESYPLLIDNATDSIHNILSRLTTIPKDHTGQQMRTDTLQKYLQAFISNQKELVNIRRNKGFEAAQKIMLNGKAKLLSNKVQSIISAIGRDENQMLAKRKTDDEQRIYNSTRIFTLFQVIFFLIMLAAVKLIYNNVKYRNKVEAALQKSLKDISDYKYALDQSSIVAITDENGIIKQVNDNFCEISKYEREELIGQDFRILNAGFHPKEFIRDLWETITNGKVWRGEIKNIAKDGTFNWVDTTIVPFLNEQGKPYQYLALRSNITHRKALEAEISQFNEALQKKVEEKTKEVIDKEQQYRFLLQNMQEGIQVIGYDWKYLFVNNTVLLQANFPNEEWTGCTIMEKYPVNENPEFFKVLRRCMKERNPEIFETEFAFLNGAREWVELSIQPVPEGLFILSMDITKRKKAEIALAESENYLRTIIQVEPDCVNLLDANGAIQEMNHAGLAMVEADDLQQLKGKPILDIIDAPYRVAYEALIQNVFKGISGEMEFEITGLKGIHRWLETHAVPLKNTTGQIISLLSVSRDITEQKKSAEAIKAYGQQLELIYNTTKDVIFLISVEDDQHYFTSVNKAFLVATGLTKEQVVGKLVNEVIPESSLSMVRDNFRKAILKKKTVQWEEISNYPAGRKIGVATITPVFNDQGICKMLVGGVHDITFIRKAKEDIEQMNKMLEKKAAELQVSNTELERFAYIASHDMQEPLRMVSSFLNLLEKRMDGKLDETTKKYIHFAVDGSEKMRQLIQDLLKYARVGTNREDFVATDLMQIMEYTTRVLEENIKTSRAVITLKPMPVITTNQTLFGQLFVNLINNAIKYHNGIQPEIEIGCTEETVHHIFYVKDNGIGIDPKFFDKIFNIFHRLHSKTEYSGTGIGLAICKKIVEIHNGKIWVESETGKGSTFYFSIPKQAATI